MTGSPVSKAYEQLITALKDVATAAKQLDLVERIMHPMLQHSHDMVAWDHIK